MTGSVSNSESQACGKAAAESPMTSVRPAAIPAPIQAARSARSRWPAPMLVPTMATSGFGVASRRSVLVIGPSSNAGSWVEPLRRRRSRGVFGPRSNVGMRAAAVRGDRGVGTSHLGVYGLLFLFGRAPIGFSKPALPSARVWARPVPVDDSAVLAGFTVLVETQRTIMYVHVITCLARISLIG